MEIKISLHQEAVRMNKIPFFRLNRELWDIVDDGKKIMKTIKSLGRQKGLMMRFEGKQNETPFA